MSMVMARDRRPVFIPFSDQGMYLAHTVGGQQSVMQILWRYHRPVDVVGLQRFRDNLARGRLARVIRPALLPFGRHQWAADHGPGCALEVASSPLEPAAMQDWIDAQVALPLDPVKGPPWNLTAQGFVDGSTTVSLVVTHCVADGMSTALAVKEAVLGDRWQQRFPDPSVRRGLPEIVRELRQTFMDIPATARGVFELLRTARARPARGRGARPALASAAAGNDFVSFPTVFQRIPVARWDARARDLGTNRFTLLAAMTAAFAEVLGRVVDGETTLLVPVNQREGLEDIGANRVSLASVKIAVGEPFGRLHQLQRRLQTVLLRTRREPDSLSTLLPLVPFVPKRAFVAASHLALDALAAMPITCTFLGVWPRDVLRIDGSEADDFCFRGVDRQVTRHSMDVRQGVASLPACIIGDDLLLTFIAYQPGRVTGSNQLRSLVADLMARYGFAGASFDA